jgi:hypothetical protein
MDARSFESWGADLSKAETRSHPAIPAGPRCVFAPRGGALAREKTGKAARAPRSIERVGVGGRRGSAAALARLFARLSHRFADREAILWRAGYDEDAWSSFEEDELARLRADLARGDASIATAFVAAVIEARFELTSPDGRDGAAGAVSSEGADENVPTLPRGAPTRPSFAQTLQSASPFVIEGPTTSDEDSLAITLSSGAQRDESKPPRRR